METLKGMFHWKSFPQAALFLWNRKLCKPSKPPACHCLHLFNANVKFLFQEICITCKLSLLIFIFIITVLPDLRVWPFSTQEWPAPNFSSQQHPWINLLNLNHIYWNNDNLTIHMWSLCHLQVQKCRKVGLDCLQTSWHRWQKLLHPPVYSRGLCSLHIAIPPPPPLHFTLGGEGHS